VFDDGAFDRTNAFDDQAFNFDTPSVAGGGTDLFVIGYM
jgi:hypothetical protein